MKYAGSQALKKIQAMLRELRTRDDLVEKTPDSFYFKSSAFLHFHEDPTRIFADLKAGCRTWTRYRVSTKDEQRNFLARVKMVLKFNQSSNSD